MTGLRRRADELLADLIPDVDERRRRWAREVRSVRDLIWHDVADLDDTIDLGAHIVVPSTGDGAFRFAGSSSFSSTADVHFGSDMPWHKAWGHIRHTADANHRFSFGVIETHGLVPARFPATNSRRFRIDTEVRMGGVVSGWTGGYHWVWAADDKWCKMWLHIRHTVKRGDGLVLAQTVRPPLELIHLENVEPVGQANPVLTGGYGGTILLDVDLDDIRQRQSMLTLDVEIRFDVELEGEADIWLRERGGPANQSIPAFDNAVRWRSAPTFLQPL